MPEEIKKICSLCKLPKPHLEFSKDRYVKDGLKSWCKICCNDKFQEWKSKNSEKVLEKSRQYEILHREKRISDKRKRREENPKQVREYNARYRRDNKERLRIYDIQRQTNQKEKRIAKQLVRNALRKGQLVKMPCEECGSIKVDGHHSDYTKPLQVQWLCPKHHARLHAAMKKKL